MDFQRDDMVFIIVNGVPRPGQIMDRRGSKYLVELYHDGDNTVSQKRFQYWRPKGDVTTFTYDLWLSNYESCPKSAFVAFRNAGGYIPPLKMCAPRRARRCAL
jgi:hypothetical protein